MQITSPAKGQKVPVGNIVISGTSSSNSTNHCTVSLNINHVKPNQQAKPTGHNAPKMITQLGHLLLLPSMLSIKQGLNTITSKYSCPNSITHYYSVNVTGVQGTGIGGGLHKSPTLGSNEIPGVLPGQ